MSQYLEFLRYFKDLLKFCVSRFAISVAYYGLTWLMTGLAGNKYLNFFIGGAVETVAYALVLPVTKRYSRLSLSRNRRDLQKQFDISVLRHIRFVVLRRKQFEQPNFTNDYVI